MPRRRRNQEEEVELDLTQLEDVVVAEEPKLNYCSRHLNQTFFKMAEDLKKDLDCIICLERICCKYCFTILNCGHYFHSSCLVQLKNQLCPTCRDFRRE